MPEREGPPRQAWDGHVNPDILLCKAGLSNQNVKPGAEHIGPHEEGIDSHLLNHRTHPTVLLGGLTSQSSRVR